MGHGKATEWWRGAVIYQIYPRSFMDTNGDGVGDLPGIIDKLDYVASLGVDAIWISPFFKSPMADFGYDIADYRDVDPLFGTLDDFDRLLAKAHALGIRVMIDQVLSHTSDQHAWFRESRMDRDNPKADWYVWADPRDDGTPPTNWMSLFGGVAWRWEPRRATIRSPFRVPTCAPPRSAGRHYSTATAAHCLPQVMGGDEYVCGQCPCRMPAVTGRWRSHR